MDATTKATVVTFGPHSYIIPIHKKNEFDIDMSSGDSHFQSKWGAFRVNSFESSDLVSLLRKCEAESIIIQSSING